ncbi:MAG: branched-chain amino acid ABC transporter permease, partial [Burkholderiaceae bacterium]
MKNIAIGVIALAVLAAAGTVLPSWAVFLVTMALAKGLVSLGIVTMMRAGVVSFGQGLFYCLGAYVAALLAQATGSTDIFLLGFAAIVVAIVVG